MGGAVSMAAGTLPAGSDDRFARSAQTPLARAWLPHAVGLAGIALLWLLQPDGAIESPARNVAAFTIVSILGVGVAPGVTVEMLPRSPAR